MKCVTPPAVVKLHASGLINRNGSEASDSEDVAPFVLLRIGVSQKRGKKQQKNTGVTHQEPESQMRRNWSAVICLSLCEFPVGGENALQHSRNMFLCRCFLHPVSALWKNPKWIRRILFLTFLEWSSFSNIEYIIYSWVTSCTEPVADLRRAFQERVPECSWASVFTLILNLFTFLFEEPFKQSNDYFHRFIKADNFPCGCFYSCNIFKKFCKFWYRKKKQITAHRG